MFIILSPSKTMNSEVSTIMPNSLPRSIELSKKLLKIIINFDVLELMKFMKISKKLADGVYESFSNYKFDLSLPQNYAAISAYTGEVYSGLNAKSYSTEDLAYAQKSLRILSGFLGVLRPLDAVIPYRLEMNSRLSTEYGTNLHHFWRNEVTDLLRTDFEATGSKYLLNLASEEYSKVIDYKALNKPIINIDFFEMRNGEQKFISFSAKRARGLLASYVIKNHVTSIDELIKFDDEGYKFMRMNESGLLLTFVKSV